jgi:hypothetical protein
LWPAPITMASKSVAMFPPSPDVVVAELAHVRAPAADPCLVSEADAIAVGMVLHVRLPVVPPQPAPLYQSF